MMMIIVGWFRGSLSTWLKEQKALLAAYIRSRKTWLDGWPVVCRFLLAYSYELSFGCMELLDGQRRIYKCRSVVSLWLLQVTHWEASSWGQLIFLNSQCERILKYKKNLVLFFLNLRLGIASALLNIRNHLRDFFDICTLQARAPKRWLKEFFVF